MTDQRIYNFNAGPSALPEKVLRDIQSSFLNFNGCGMSVTEISHRSPEFDQVINDAVARAKRLLKLDDRFHVLFIQGGASLQFAMIPMNFLARGQSADYVNTGTWSTKAIKEAQIQKKEIRVIASSEDRDFCYIPKNIVVDPKSRFVHLTSNNTIKGTQFASFPDTGNVPIICDMSSDFFSRPLPMDKFAMIYGGAQKNLGPSGTAVVILRKDFLEAAAGTPENQELPSMLRYDNYAQKNSMYNTPACFGIYTIGLVLKWIEEDMGGLEGIEKYNQEKARLLYDFMDASDFYRPTADKDSRSLMNVTFRLPSEELEKQFIAQATQEGLGGLKGHRSVGGCRASIYNAVTLEGVKALIVFMEKFQKEAA